MSVGNDFHSYLYFAGADESLHQLCEQTAARFGMASVRVRFDEPLPRVGQCGAASCLVVDWNDGREPKRPLQASLGVGNGPSSGRQIPAIVCVDDPDVFQAVRLMEQGALTVFAKPVPAHTFRDYVRQAVLRDQQQMQLYGLHAEVRTALQSLTPRQIEVLDGVVAGAPSKTIASRLGISKRLVELERSEILRVFRVDSTPNVTMKMGQYSVLDQIITRIDGPQSSRHRHGVTTDPMEIAGSAFGADSPAGRPD